MIFAFTCGHQADADAREQSGKLVCNVCGAEVRRPNVCPPEHFDGAKRSFIGAVRIAREQIITLRLAAIEIGERDAARRMFEMSQDLAAIAGRVGA